MQELVEPPAAAANFCATHHLRLKGQIAEDFRAQFRRVAETPLAHAIEGDQLSFQQALIFPLAHSYSGGDPITYAGVAPLLILELTNGYLVAVQIRDCSSGRCSLFPLVSQLANYFEDIQVNPREMASAEGYFRRLFRRNIVCIDLELHDFASSYQKLFPALDEKVANRLFGGISGTSAIARREVKSVSRRFLTEGIEQTFSKFIDRLDPTLCSLVRARGQSLSVNRYNQYCGRARSSVDFLLQALKVIPLLNSLLDGNGFESKRLQHLIADGQPLWPALVSVYRVPEETLRWLRGKDFDLIGHGWHDRLPQLLGFLGKLPPEKRPLTSDDWRIFNGFALNFDDQEDGEIQNTWLSALARMGWQKAQRKMEAMQATVADVQVIPELIEEICSAIMVKLFPDTPEWQRHENPDWPTVHRAVYKSYLASALMKQLRASMDWHTLQLEIIEKAADATLTPVVQENAWPVPLIAPMRLGNIYAHFLGDKMQLQEEGQRMHHCVGSYSGRCMLENTSIVSLRSQQGRSLSTAHLKLIKNADSFLFSVREHKGPGNTAPSELCADALEALLRHLHSEIMKPVLKELHARQLARAHAANVRSHLLAEHPLSSRRFGLLQKSIAPLGGFERFLTAAQQAIGCVQATAD